jgi:MinD superfamily P-loop ATPase
LKIAILSGKGGTGKTTLSVNLFSYLKRGTLIDTDTEEPNSHIFLKGTEVKTSNVLKNHPVVDHDKCTFCGKCGEHCNFNAIIPTKKKVIVFEDLCHDCGFCKIVCESGAIMYQEKAIGTVITNNR